MMDSREKTAGEEEMGGGGGKNMQREEIKSQTKISKLVPPCSPTSISSD